ncbi:uncharacterized protein LOC133365898 [Rhineura floridana]|uniref:uncharacterized protein LOC133365898 n=1 Tax=Rhineura floridana TaxID=261503 RepID=UPI002AC83645|nr:uncharacterized protein LOC133365898 [Rhineura floridana]
MAAQETPAPSAEDIFLCKTADQPPVEGEGGGSLSSSGRLRRSAPWRFFRPRFSAEYSASQLLLDALSDLGEDELKTFKNKLREVPLKQNFEKLPEEKLEEADASRLRDLLIDCWLQSYAVEVTAEVLKAMGREFQADRLSRLAGKAWFTQDHLRNILEMLTESELKKFSDILHEYPIKQGFRTIPKELLEGANASQIRDLLLEYYDEDYAVQVVVTVLMAVGCKYHAQCLYNRKTEAWFPHVYLLNTLEMLEEFDLKEFKVKLQEFPVKEGFTNIPKELLEEANVWQLRDLLLYYYDEDYAIEVTAEVLKAIDCKPEADWLLYVIRKGWFKRVHLLNTLELLRTSDLMRFRRILFTIPKKEGITNIPRRFLEEASFQGLSDLLISYYGEDYAVEVTIKTLKFIGCQTQADILYHLSCQTERPPFSSKIDESRHQPANFLSLKIIQGLKRLVSSGRATKRLFGKFTISGEQMIRKGREELIEILEKDIELFLHVLHSHSVITLKEFTDLYKTEEDSKRKSHKLLKIILERGEQACCRFLKDIEMLCPDSIQTLLFALYEEGRSVMMEDPTDYGESVLCFQCPTEDLPEQIIPEVVWDSQKSQETYRLCPTEAGSFLCCYTDLIFEVSRAVTITYHFDSWRNHLSRWDTWKSVAGPLLNIHAHPEEAVAAVHFPHFLCLAGEDSSEVYIAHFVEGGMSLEKPDRVGPFHAVLKTPSFSPRGVIFKKSWFKRKIKVHAVALLYQELEILVPKFHLYLLPNDSSLRKAVDEHEGKCPSWRMEKPPVTLKPLTVGSRFFVQTLDGVRICPKELEFQYLHADMMQQYLELYAEHMQDGLELNVIEKNKYQLIWEAYVRRDELKSPVLHPAQGASGHTQTAALCFSTTSGTCEANPSGSSDLHFIDQHREQLIQRTSNVEGVLDLLCGTILDEEQYQKISLRGTNPEKMRELYRLVPSWNRACKEKLYRALKTKNPFLIADLEGR